MLTDVLPLIEEEIDIKLSRLNFHEFCLFMKPEVYKNRPVLKLATAALQEILDQYRMGKALRVAISMPPRYGKSLTASLFCVYWLGQFPESSILRASATNRLYQKFSYDCRQLIRSIKYRKVFPLVQLSADKQSLDAWNLTTAKQVSYFGGGYGTSIIGMGCNCACTDDMYPGITEAMSPVYNENLIAWKQGSFNSRMEKNSPEIYIGTRWSKNDLIGKAIEEDRIDTVIRIPALDENEQSTCEDVKSTEEYQKIKDETDEEIWEAEYMQNPVEIKGLLFPKSQLQFYDPEWLNACLRQKKHEFELSGVHMLRGIDYKYQHVDPADKGGDYLAAPICYLFGDCIYIPDVVFNQDGTDISIPTIVDLICSYKLDHADIEGNGGWHLFGKDVRRKVREQPPEGRGYADCEIRIIKNTTNKETRILAESAFIKNHFYFRSDYEKFPEYKMFIKKLTAYMREGTNQEDGAPDSLAGCSKFFRNRFPRLW